MQMLYRTELDPIQGMKEMGRDSAKVRLKAFTEGNLDCWPSSTLKNMISRSSLRLKTLADSFSKCKIFENL